MRVKFRKIFFFNKAFTLVELLVSVTILAILAAIAIPSYRKYTTKARYMEGVNFLLECSEQLKATYLADDAFPPTGCSGVAKGDFSTNIKSASIEQLHYNYNSNQIWFAVIFKPSVVTGTSWESRAIHIGGTFDSSIDDFVWYCGRWNTSFFTAGDMSLLPDKCNESSVSSKL